MTTLRPTPALARLIHRRSLRIILGALAAAMCVAVLFAMLHRESEPLRSAPLEARLELAAGEVLIVDGTDERRAYSGTALLGDTRLKTAQGSRALVRLPSGASVFLRGGTEIRLDKGRLLLESGEYWLDAPPLERDPVEYYVQNVQVSASDAGVSIKREGETALVYVARGTAAINSAAGRVEARAGEQVRVNGKQAPVRSPVAFWDDWTGGMADTGTANELSGAGAGKIYGVDEGAPHGQPVARLDITKQVVRAVVRNGLSETEVDQTFFNSGERDVEGWYWFTLPERASVTGFALETNGQLIDGEFIERREADRQYRAAKSAGFSPAILEYVQSRAYRARIHPIPAGGTRRVVLRYIELRPVVDGKIEYVYPMGSGDPVRIGEFALSVNLGDAGKKLQLSTLEEARIEQEGSLVTVRRSGYTPRAPFQLVGKTREPMPPFTVARFTGDDETADYILAQYLPDPDWSKVKKARADVVLVVDSSAGGDEADQRLKTVTAEAVLRSLSADDNFAVATLDIGANVVFPREKLSAATPQAIFEALERLSSRTDGGATDLSALFDVTLQRLHGTDQPAVIYVGDGLATSGEMSADQLVQRLRRALSSSRARFFAVGIGSEANHELLASLARAGGGESFSVDENDQATARALELIAAIKKPTITDLKIELGAGLDEVFSSAAGKVSRGQQVTILARTHHELPKKAKVTGTIGATAFEREYEMNEDTSVARTFVPRLWAAEYVRRLLGEGQGANNERGRIVKLGVDYGLVTPFTSLLALESEQAYQQMGIPRRSTNLRAVRLSALRPEREAELGFAAPPAPVAAMGCTRKDEPSAGHLGSARNKQTDTPAASSPVVPVRTEELAAPPPVPSEENGAAVFRAAAGAAPKRASAPASGEKAAKDVDREKPIGSGSSDASDKQSDAKATNAAPAAGRRSQDPLEATSARLRGPSGSSLPRPRADLNRQSRLTLASCSDTSAQPLALRAALWWRRLAAAKNDHELIERYETASRACELDSWRAQRVFLNFLQLHIQSASVAEGVLSYFASQPDVQRYVGRLLLRRTVDQELVSVVQRKLIGANIDWEELDMKLQGIPKLDERLARLTEALNAAPDDPDGTIRLVRLLMQSGRGEEAVALGNKLRDSGFFNPELARQLGDVLVLANRQEDALRTYSEMVEFDAGNHASRQLLGDTFLAHGWYDAAYRQYETLVEATSKQPLALLRLAAAAAGSGRVDEALRIERRVASAEGTPGPDDPRRWARLWSAARLGELLRQSGGDPQHGAQIQRELKDLQLWSSTGALVLLTWENLQADLTLAAQQDGRPVALRDTTDAADIGLYAAYVTSSSALSKWLARRTGPTLSSAVKLRLHTIAWDGTRFTVTRVDRSLSPEQLEVRFD
jgi:hypothetical protein